MFVGERGAPIGMEPVAVLPDGSLVPIDDGDELPLHTPLQGGKVVLAGALLANVELVDCGRLRIGALLRDPTDPDERAVKNEERHVRYAEMPDRPGWAMPVLVSDERNMSPNLEACGFTAYPRDVDGCSWILEVRLEDTHTEEILASVRRDVVPVCPADDPGDPGVPRELEQVFCQCQCAADYQSGRCDLDDLDGFVDPAPACE